MRFGLPCRREAFLLYSARQPPRTCLRAAILPRVSPLRTVYVPLLPRETEAARDVAFFFTDLRVVERLTRGEPPLSARDRPSLREQEGQAFQPCASRTFSAIRICWERLARSARLAYLRPPKPPPVPPPHCRPPHPP